MTKRYFYTDPLAAAWMAKHHGMRFQHNPDGNECDIQALFAAGVFRFQKMMLYIHPDSLAILEPKPLDLAWNEEKRLFFFFGSLPQGEVNGYKIILRNGKHFLWPEVEEV